MQSNVVEILKDIGGPVDPVTKQQIVYRSGEVVDASGWSKLEKLIDQRVVQRTDRKLTKSSLNDTNKGKQPKSE